MRNIVGRRTHSRRRATSARSGTLRIWTRRRGADSRSRSTSLRATRNAQVGAPIGVWAHVAGERELARVYRGVLVHLDTPLALAADPDYAHRKEKTKEKEKEKEKKVAGRTETALRTLDILLVLVPYLPAAEKTEVVAVVVRGGVLRAGESAVQKAGMRLAGRLVDLGGKGALASVGAVSGLAATRCAGATAGGKVSTHPLPVCVNKC